jgi:hypothetical protein
MRDAGYTLVDVDPPFRIASVWMCSLMQRASGWEGRPVRLGARRGISVSPDRDPDDINVEIY